MLNKRLDAIEVVGEIEHITHSIIRLESRLLSVEEKSRLQAASRELVVAKLLIKRRYRHGEDSGGFEVESDTVQSESKGFGK